MPHDMRHVDSERPVLPRHALRDHSQPGLGRGKVRKARLAAQAGGGADDLAVAERSETPGRLAADQKPAKAADRPERLEGCGGELPENDPLVAAVVRR
jgi:hypothetical protein